MSVTDFTLRVLCFIVTARIVFSDKNYDVVYMAKRLYGMEFEMVLKTFRRSTDYLRILQDKLNDLRQIYQDYITQAKVFHLKKQKKRVYEVLMELYDKDWMNNTEEVKKMKEKITEKPGFLRRFPNVLRNKSRRQNSIDEDENDDDQSKIEALDSNAAKSKLTLAQRIKMRDLGFQTAGSIINDVIKNLGGTLENITTTTERITMTPTNASISGEMKATTTTTTETGNNDRREKDKRTENYNFLRKRHTWYPII